MAAAVRHRWDLSPQEAVALQQVLSARVVAEDRLGEVRTVAGVDVAFPEEGFAIAAVAVLDATSLVPVAQAVVREAVSFPYLPGLLSFREAPAAISALQRLPLRPDLLLCDGQGLAHPRRFGLACHLGLLTGIPSIGVAKTRLVGEHEELPAERGSWVELRHDGDVVGAVLRTRTAVKPVYVSVGHLVGLDTAVAWVLRLALRYRLPETTRLAHHLSISA